MRTISRIVSVFVLALSLLAGASAPAWSDVLTPNNNEQMLWLRADAGVFNAVSGGSATTNGGEVRRWEDQSGHGYHALGDIDTTFTPNYSSAGGPGGQPALNFTRNAATGAGAGDWLHLPNAALPTNSHTIFMVYEAEEGLNQQLFGRVFSSAGLTMVAGVGGDNNTFRYGVNANTNFTPIDSTGQPNLITAIYDDPGDLQTLKLDGTTAGTFVTATGASNYNATDLAAIGISASTSTSLGGRASPLSGMISEIIVYDRVLTEEEENLVGSYLAGKYGIDSAYAVAAVPEPMSITIWTLLSLGCVGYGVVRHRRKPRSAKQSVGE